MDQKNQIKIGFNLLRILLIIISLVLIGKFLLVTVYYHDGYSEMGEYQSQILVREPLPRGKIYDKNGNLLVGNTQEKNLMYIETGIMTSDEKDDLAREIASLITIEDSVINETDLKDFWMSRNDYNNYYEVLNNRITQEEEEIFDELEDYEKNELLRSKVTEEDLEELYEEFTEEELYIRVKMEGATATTPVIIKENLTEDEYYALVQNYGSLGGFYIIDDWERYYPYGETLSSFLGGVGLIPVEDYQYYQSLGYSPNEEVGTSYIEKELEPLLHSIPQTYKLYFDEDGNIMSHEVYEEGQLGYDVYLTIDIEFQIILEELILEYLEKNNYKYYTSTYVTVLDPNNGDIIAIAGYTDYDGNYYEDSIGNFTRAYEMGSVVKPAILLIGYDTGSIQHGTVIVDEPMKIKDTPEKSSTYNMGPVNDLEAIAQSSNVYFWKTALLIAGEYYVENEAINITKSDFDFLRKELEQFGLGTSTGIDVENEHTGYSGSKYDPGFYLDLAVGQYDTYTTLQLAQYVMTIANGGTRYKIQYIDKVTDASGAIIYEENSVVLNTLSMSSEDIERTQLAMEGCVNSTSGTGYLNGYKNLPVSSACKTGTAESYVWDEDLNATVSTNNSTFIGYAPADDPEIAFAVAMPHYIEDGGKGVDTASKLAKDLVEAYFDMYPVEE